MNLANESLNASVPLSGGFMRLPHHAIAYGSNCSNFDGHKQLIKQSTEPLPIFSTNFQCQNMKDPATSLTLAKQKLQREKDTAKTRWKRCPKEPAGTINDAMVSYIEVSEASANLYGSVEYDWHFTGGSLMALPSNQLIQSTMRAEYPVRVLSSSSDFRHANLQPEWKCSEKEFVYELMMSDTLVGIRQKEAFRFLSRDDLTDDDDEYEAVKELKWNHEVTASALSRNLVFADVTNKIYRCNLDQMLVQSFMKMLPLDRAEPVSISCLDDNVSTYTSLKALNLVDFRANIVETIFDSSKFHMSCEELSYHKPTLNDNLLYLVSSHLLYGIDRRFDKEPLMHWTHQLIQQPTMLDRVKLNDDEIICLSSNKPGDLKLFHCSEGTQADSWCISRVPYKPRNIRNSYQGLREEGLLLLSENIKHRVSLSTTGIAMIAYETSPRVELFTQNSLGDIYKSFLYCDEEHSADHEVKSNFLQWEESLNVERSALKYLTTKERQTNGELYFTDIVKLRGLRKVMRCNKITSRKDEDESMTMATEKVPRWKISLDEAAEYRDILSQHLLAEWDLKMDEAQPKIFADALAAGKLHQLNKVDKVASWLQGSVGDDQEMEAEEATVLFEEVKDEVFESNVLTQDVTATQQSKKTKKSSQRVKGF